MEDGSKSQAGCRGLIFHETKRAARGSSKEVFAYLVHKQGSSCTTREIFAAIFEDAED